MRGALQRAASLGCPWNNLPRHRNPDTPVEKEETFRGHLLMTFIATVVLQMLQNKIKQSTFSLDRILARMRTQKAKVFEQTVIPAEPVKEHNDIYKLLGIKPPKELPIKMRSNV